jgi:hypothetical protein
VNALGREHLLLVVVMMAGCAHNAQKPEPVYSPAAHRVVALPAESAAYPTAAERATDFLLRTRVQGFDPPELSKVSLEVVQLSIECVEATSVCYTAVGKQLAANQLLFAQFEDGPKPDQVRVSVTLFDVDGATMKKRARKLFDSEEDAVYGMREVVEEATKP